MIHPEVAAFIAGALFTLCPAVWFGIHIGQERERDRQRTESVRRK